MKNNPIIIINGEPKSIFLEIFFKALKYKNYKSPLILISSLKLLKSHMKNLNFKKKINLVNLKSLNNKQYNNNSINLIDIKINQNLKSNNKFIENTFKAGLDIINKGITNKFINGPISKKKFLKKKFPGITEYLAKKNNSKKFAMLIYNNKLAVCPLTTHVPIKKVNNFITKKNIKEKVELINDFYEKFRGFKPKIAVLGLNPHCESTDKFNEDNKIVSPVINNLKNLGYKISGPYSADTAFLKANRKKFNVILGMYHDQVLTPFKTLYEYDAINITLGLSFIRITPDHGPNIQMLGKNKSNPISLINAIKFLDKN